MFSGMLRGVGHWGVRDGEGGAVKLPRPGYLTPHPFLCEER